MIKDPSRRRGWGPRRAGPAHQGAMSARGAGDPSQHAPALLQDMAVTIAEAIAAAYLAEAGLGQDGGFSFFGGLGIEMAFLQHY